MTQKRKYPSPSALGISNKKRPRTSSLNDDDGGDESSSKAPQPRVDPTYGQRGAFPGIEGDEEDTLFYGPASDGLEYLRMVR